MRGHVRQRGEKWVFVVDLGRDEVTGKRKQKWSKGFEKKKDAEKALTKFLHELETGTYIEPTKMTLGQFLDKWLESYAKPHTAPRTYEGYEYIVRVHLKPFIGHIPLEKLKPMHIQDYYKDKLSEGRFDGTGGLSAQSVLHHHRLLKNALNHAVKWGLVLKNVVDMVDSPRPEQFIGKSLDFSQAITLVEELLKFENYYYPTLFFDLFSGLRRSEVLGLKWSDIDFDNKVARITQTLQRVKGKGLIFKSTKNKSSAKPIDLSNSMIAILEKVKKLQSANRLKFGKIYNNNDLVFSQPNGKPIEPSEFGREFKKILKKLNLPNIRLHDLRHSHATLLLTSGANLKAVQERLRHSKSAITLDIYSHALPNIQRESVDRFEEIIMSKVKTKIT